MLSHFCISTYLCLAALFFLSAETSWKSKDGCPCETPELCDPIDFTLDKEVVGFVVNKDNWDRYNWTHITTLMMFTELPPDLMCYAHSKGVRVVLGGLNGFSVANLTNATARSTWIATQLQLVQESFADGINLDIEEAVKNGSMEQNLLTLFVEEVFTAFKGANKNYQVTYDVAWSPNCIDGRCYDVVKFAAFTDFLVVMSYDEQSQIYGPCIAMANAPLSKTELGVKQYLDLGIDPSKLVLGQPWYGYDYLCTDFKPDDVCYIKKVPYHGAPCSDAAGQQRDYSYIRDLIAGADITVKWNSTYQAPYFQHKFADTINQFWFDNPQSLSIKYAMAKQLSLRGLAFWNVDSLDYLKTPRSQNDTAAMWAAIDAFFD